jgi:hypothetical protein
VYNAERPALGGATKQDQEMIEYHTAALRYRPAQIRVLFIAESPPAFDADRQRSYFFFEQNPGSEVLFATVTAALYAANYRKAAGDKAMWLRRMQTDGYWLIDAVEQPINRLAGRVTTATERAWIIRENIPGLLARLETLRHDGMLQASTGVILIKKLVFDTLSPVLRASGYNLLHHEKIDFPKYHKDRDTIRGITCALATLNRSV